MVCSDCMIRACTSQHMLHDLHEVVYIVKKYTTLSQQLLEKVTDWQPNVIYSGQ